MNFLDRNEFNFEPSDKVVEAIKNFDPKTLCFYTRIYDQGKKSVISVRLSEIYGVPEEQVLLAYGGEDIMRIPFIQPKPKLKHHKWAVSTLSQQDSILGKRIP